MLALNDVPSLSSLELPGVAVEAVEIETREAKFDLTLFLAESGGRLRRPSGVQPRPLRSGDGRSPAGALAHPARRSGGGAGDPPLRALRCSPPWSASKLAAWSRPPRPRSRPVERPRADRRARRPASGCRSRRRRRREPDLRRAAAAGPPAGRPLRRLGVGPDVPVGIFLDRSLDLAWPSSAYSRRGAPASLSIPAIHGSGCA